MSYEEFEVRLQRHAFNLREVARVLPIWQLVGDAAIVGSSRRGWTIPRYLELGIGFVVRSELIVHHREIRFDEPLLMGTWVSAVEDAVRSIRQFRLRAAGTGEPLVSGTQEWVQVSMATRAAVAGHPRILADLPPVSRDADPELPAWERAIGGSTSLVVEPWITSMDTLGHVNHTDPVGWCDESVARAARAAGLDPLRIAPVAEKLRFVNPVEAGDRVTVETKAAGITAAGDAVFAHRVVHPDRRVAAVATTVRRLVDGAGRELLGALGQ